jgi:hypothetical protein
LGIFLIETDLTLIDSHSALFEAQQQPCRQPSFK